MSFEVRDGDRPVAVNNKAVPFRPQFRIQSLTWMIAFTAVGLAIDRWFFSLLTLVIMAFPAGLLAERLFGARPKLKEPPPTFFTFAVRVAAVIVCGCLCSAVAWYSSSEPMPTILSPFPILVVVAIFSDDAFGFNGYILSEIFAFASFILTNAYQLRRAALLFVLSIALIVEPGQMARLVNG